MKSAVSIALALCLALGAWALWAGRAPAPGSLTPAHPSTLAAQSSRRAPAPLPALEQVRWLAIGGGGTPELNQVSIEQDVGLARELLGAGGVILFAGGPGSRDVQQLTRERRGDALLRTLADLFAPRGGRDSVYRQSVLPVNAAATLPIVQRTLEQVVQRPGPAVTLFVAGHGERGTNAADNWVELWGRSRLSARLLARWLDAARRTVRVISTTCYGGGFAELAFAGADPKKGAPKVVRCGLFATTHDLPAAGCDPNPDRASQQGYALHFFNALRGRDRDGRPLAAGSLDLDGDGTVSPLEAHARARIASRTADVPSSTSERWLHQVAPPKGTRAAVEAPEERAVIAALAPQLKLSAELPPVRAALDALERRIAAARKRSAGLDAVEDEQARALAAELLSRWPVLDDPWHPDFGATLARHRTAIAEHLRRSAAHAAYRRAREQASGADERHWTLRRQAAPVERLLRALENVDAVARLRAKGGADWQTYRSLLACERARPL